MFSFLSGPRDPIATIPLNFEFSGSALKKVDLDTFAVLTKGIRMWVDSDHNRAQWEVTIDIDEQKNYTKTTYLDVSTGSASVYTDNQWT